MVRRKRVERHRERARLPTTPCGPAHDELGAREAYDKKRSTRPFRQMLDDVEQGGLGPVGVFQDEDQRLTLAALLEKATQGEVELGRDALRR